MMRVVPRMFNPLRLEWLRDKKTNRAPTPALNGKARIQVEYDQRLQDTEGFDGDGP